MISLKNILDEVKPIRKGNDSIRKQYINFHDAIDFFDLEEALHDEMSNWDYTFAPNSSDDNEVYDGYSLMSFISDNIGYDTLKKHNITENILMMAARKYWNFKETDTLTDVDQKQVDETYNQLLRSAQNLDIL